MHLVPVPSHRSRLVERGYNPAALLAAALARRAGARVSHVLVRRRTAPPQHQLSRAERLANLHGAFSATKRLDGRSIMLVDDVVSTGTTLSECALALREAGAQRVDALVVASPAAPASRRSGEPTGEVDWSSVYQSSGQ